MAMLHQDLVRELKKTTTLEHEADRDINCNWCAQNNSQRIGTWSGGLEHEWTSGDHPDYRIVKIGQNTEKSPENLSRLSVTPVKKHQQTLA